MCFHVETQQLESLGNPDSPVPPSMTTTQSFKETMMLFIKQLH